MFRVILWGQWKWSRLAVVLGAIVGFALPILSVQGAAGGRRTALPPDELRAAVHSWGTLYPVLAAALGLLVALAAWAPDHRGRHVHALTLPVERWRYVLLRFAAGVTLLMLPIFAVQTGALLATATATIPAGMQGYPLALGLRFALATLVAFSVFFAVSGSTPRTAGTILAILAAVVVVQVVAGAADLQLDLISPVIRAFLDWPGPLAIFGGRWMLIDV